MAGNGNRGRGNNYRTSNQRRSNNNTRKTASNKNVKNYDNSQQRDLGFFLFFGLMLLLFLCNFGIIGTFGDAISGFMFGSFGLLAFVLPVFASVAVLFGYANRDNSIGIRKLVFAILLFAVIGAIIDFFGKRVCSLDEMNVKAAYELCKEVRSGGGVVFGAISAFIVKFLGRIGTGFVLFLLVFVCLVVISEGRLLEYIKNKSIDTYQYVQDASERNAMRLEERQNRQALLPDKEVVKEESTKNVIALRDTDKTELVNKEHEEKEKIKKEPVIAPTVTEKLKGRLSEISEERRLHKEEKETNRILRVSDSAFAKQDQFRDMLMGNESNVYKEDVHEVYYDELDNNYSPSSDYSYSTDNYAEASTPDEMIDDNRSFDFEMIKIPDSHKVTISNYDSVEEARRLNKPEAWTKYDEVEEIVADETSESSLTDMDDAALVGGGNEALDDAFDTEFESNVSVQDSDLYPTVKRFHQMSLDEVEIAPPKPKTETKAPFEAKATERPATAPIRNESHNKILDKPYQLPPISLLKKGVTSGADPREELAETSRKLEETLASFGVHIKVQDVSRGPAVTRYEMVLTEPGVKVSKILGLTDDIKLSLAAADIRIEAPIPGKSAIGIEVPNKENSVVAFRDLLESNEFKNFNSKIGFAVGKDIGGQTVVFDIAKMPHVLIAGATGSGKSVCINTLIMSILYKATPEEVRLIMVDPKVVELSVYNGIPHLLLPVVTDPKKASLSLKWAVKEMEDRYRKFAQFGVRDMKGYNEKMKSEAEPGSKPEILPQIVIIIDELADLMMVCANEVEESICRLAQLARAAGIHLVVATQRPSVDVITGLIKANMPSRIAFAVSSGVDSRTILDSVGAEKLLGRGDMLFYPNGYPKPARVQGAFVSDDEVSDVTNFIRSQMIGNDRFQVIDDETLDKMDTPPASNMGGNGSAVVSNEPDQDELLIEAGRIVVKSKKASIGYLQRMLKIGFNRAARIMDTLAEMGVVGPEQGTKPREILMSEEEFESFASTIN